LRKEEATTNQRCSKKKEGRKEVGTLRDTEKTE